MLSTATQTRATSVRLLGISAANQPREIHFTICTRHQAFVLAITTPLLQSVMLFLLLASSCQSSLSPAPHCLTLLRALQCDFAVPKPCIFVRLAFSTPTLLPPFSLWNLSSMPPSLPSHLSLSSPSLLCGYLSLLFFLADNPAPSLLLSVPLSNPHPLPLSNSHYALHLNLQPFTM